MKKQEKKMENGYTSFNRNDINTEDNRNSQAEKYFLEMLDIPKRASKKIKKGNTVTDSDFYPCTLQETEQMDELLKKAETAVDDPSDREFMGYLQEMRGVLDWSKKRHWQIAWWIIVCVFIMGCYYFNETGAQVENRDKIEKTPIEEYAQKRQADITEYENKIKQNPQSQSVEYWQEQVKKYSDMTDEDYKARDLKWANDRVWEDRGSAIWCFVWIALYILAMRPLGYMITKRRKETAVYSGMKKFLFIVAGSLIGGASALRTTVTITKWSDGSTTREDNGMVILAMKAIMIFGAILLVLWVARIVIVIATIMGFIRNYNLRQIFQTATAKVNKKA